MGTRTSEQQAARERNRILYLEGLRSGADTLPNRPLELYLEITTHCNIRCVFCAREHDLGYLTGQRVGNIDSELIRRVANLLPTADVVYPLGFGEPFLHREFIPIVEQAKRGGASIQFNTNGTLIDEDASRRLVAARADTMVLSLDGATKATFEEIRKGASFDQIITNLRFLHATKKEAGSEFPKIYVEFVAMRSNFAELVALVELAHSIGAVGVHVEPLVPHSPGLHPERITDYRKEPYRSIVEEAVKRARDLEISLVGRGISEGLPPLCEGEDETPTPEEPAPSSPEEKASSKANDHATSETEASRETSTGEPEAPPDTVSPPVSEDPAADSRVPEKGDPSLEAEVLDHVNSFLFETSRLDPSSSSALETRPSEGPRVVSLLCSQPFTTVYVGYQGRVGTCCLGNHDLGNLREQGIEEIWNGPRFQALRKAMRTGEVPFECRDCVQQGRIPPMRFNDSDVTVETPEIRYQDAPTLEPVEEKIPLDLSILEVRKVATSQDLYLKAAFSMSWDKSLHAEVHLEAVAVEEPSNPEPTPTRPLLAPVRAVFPPGYDEVRSLSLTHGILTERGEYPTRVRISVKDAANGRTLIAREAPVNG